VKNIGGPLVQSALNQTQSQQGKIYQKRIQPQISFHHQQQPSSMELFPTHALPRDQGQNGSARAVFKRSNEGSSSTSTSAQAVSIFGAARGSTWVRVEGLAPGTTAEDVAVSLAVLTPGLHSPKYLSFTAKRFRSSDRLEIDCCVLDNAEPNTVAPCLHDPSHLHRVSLPLLVPPRGFFTTLIPFLIFNSSSLFPNHPLLS